MRFLLTTSSPMESLLELIGVLLIFVFVLVITYMCSKWMAGFQKTTMKNKNLQVIESIPAGSNKTICLVKAGTQYIVVAVGKDEIHPLTTLTEEQLSDVSFLNEDSSKKEESFQEIFGQLKNKWSKK